MHTIASPLMWAALFALVGGLLAVDLGFFNRRGHAPSFREALGWSVTWVTVAVVFGAVVFHLYGADVGTEFFTGYLLEKALSVDNLFVMLTLLAAFRVPEGQRHRVLFFGVLGALVLRAVFIAVGLELVAVFKPVLVLFGAFLALTAVRMVWPKAEPLGVPSPPTDGHLVRLARRVFPVVDGVDDRFFVRRPHGGWAATSLFLALVAIEGADLVFAVDSIPAVFAVTQDPFVVFSSNVLAMLGLRALFFVLAAFVERFHLLKYGLAGVLLFVGGKMMLAAHVHLAPLASLAVIAALLTASVVASLLTRPKPAPAPAVPNPTPWAR